MKINAQKASVYDETPHVFLNAGTHGDEHESMNALASLVRNRELPPEISYDVIFCANPHGYRQSHDKRSASNRTFFSGRKYIGVQYMHENFEVNGAYIYEDVRDFKKSVLAPAIKSALLEKHMPLQEAHLEFDLGLQKGSDRIVHRYEPDVVLADAAAESIAFKSPGMMLITKMCS